MQKIGCIVKYMNALRDLVWANYFDAILTETNLHDYMIR